MADAPPVLPPDPAPVVESSWTAEETPAWAPEEPAWKRADPAAEEPPSWGWAGSPDLADRDDLPARVLGRN
ncbi:hypothetical protein SAMN05661080_00889 [Modestobacter sp. DSM 44400]|uniref:hypothetical protein n=1 Tax=Modestobacter sp. DSM 44400 TaxID=1550230 RepID=UPI0008997B20|nr:hypothetical protein [Modestobacter sp. DSM 44400]SDX70869.1 hypothetical protein SAMN05661080_00889 [Modestobacter sp. DSM 44400]